MKLIVEFDNPTPKVLETLGLLMGIPQPPQTEFEPLEDTAENLTPPETDKFGIRWDERIHSTNRQLTQDGLWRKKRGVPQPLIDQVEKEQQGPPPPPPVTDPLDEFISCVTLANNLIYEGKMTKEKVNQLCQSHGDESIQALGQQMDKTPLIAQALQKFMGPV